jgi:hypothetical protein
VERHVVDGELEALRCTPKPKPTPKLGVKPEPTPKLDAAQIRSESMPPDNCSTTLEPAPPVEPADEEAPPPAGPSAESRVVAAEARAAAAEARTRYADARLAAAAAAAAARLAAAVQQAGEAVGLQALP